ncbi:MAG: hypothetical protein HY722_10505 [Planctomycetes bacterium]|nr:hypothetical protein [Planctomycetota bacterium]
MTTKDGKQGPRRLNHFHGQTLNVDDYQADQGYFLEKLALLHRTLHGYGVVGGHAGELRVVARGRGEAAVDVEPGYAIDGEGHDIIVWEPQVCAVDLAAFGGRGTAHVVLRYAEEPTDYVEDPQNPRYKGYTRTLETFRIDVAKNPPHPLKGVELARVAIDDTVQFLADPRDPAAPGPGEIDRRFVPRVRRACTDLEPASLLALGAYLQGRSALHGELARRLRIEASREARLLADLARVLLALASPGLPELRSALRPLAEREVEALQALGEARPDLAAEEAFRETAEDAAELVRRLADERLRGEDLQGLLQRAAEAGSEALRRTEAEPVAPPPAPPSAEKGPEPEPEFDPARRDKLIAKLHSVGHLPPSFEVLGLRFRRVDEISVGDAGSEGTHGWRLEGASEEGRERAKFLYPDGSEAQDTGRRWKGGQAVYTLKGLTPGRPLVLLKRVDIGRGEMSSEVRSERGPVGTWEVHGSDRQQRWRNVHFVVEAAHVLAATLRLTEVADRAGRDQNAFRIWVYQAE